MKDASREYLTSSYCNFAECVGFSPVYAHAVTGQEMVDIVNTKVPDQVIRSVARDWLAWHIIAIQEELMTAEELIVWAGGHSKESQGFLHYFTDEEVTAFYEGAYMGDFDELAGVMTVVDEIPDTMTLEAYLGLPVGNLRYGDMTVSHVPEGRQLLSLAAVLQDSVEIDSQYTVAA